MGGEGSIPVATSTTPQPASPRPTRRRFSVEEKLRILAEYEAGASPEARGAVLRGNGIYSSHISAWRHRRDGGGAASLDRKRGPKPDPQKGELERLRRENARLTKRNVQLERIVEVQGKVQALLQELGSKEIAPSSEPSRKTP
jgi:transposase-like protein